MNKKISAHIVLLLSLLSLSVTVTSCFLFPDDPEPDQISTNINELIFNGSAGEQLTATITANTNWSITYIPEWLDVSSKEGTEGTVTLNFTTRQKNESTSEITGEVQFKAGEATLTINVTQRSPYAKDCSAKVIDALKCVMAYGFACNFECSENCTRYRWHLFTDEEYQRLRGDNDAMENDAQTNNWEVRTPQEPFVLAVNNLEPQNRYHLVTIAYNLEGKRGDIETLSFDTPSAKYQPRATITMQPSVITKNNTNYYQWEMTPNEFCEKYYVYICVGNEKFQSYTMAEQTGNGSYSDRSGILMAWHLNADILESDESREVHYNGTTDTPKIREFFFPYRNSSSIIDDFEAKPSDRYIEIITWGMKGTSLANIVTDKIYTIDSSGNIVDANPDGTSPEPPTPTPHTSALPTTLSFDYTASTQNVTVTSNEQWTATSDASSWCTVTPASGSNNGTVQVKASPNSTTNERTAHITITGKNSGDKVTITVTQKAAPPHTTATPTSLSFDYAGSTQNVAVTSNEQWTATSNATSWCTVTPASGSNNGTVQVKATANTNTTERTAHITVTGKSSGDKTIITVTQDPKPYTTVKPTTLTFNESSGSQDLTIESNEQWTVSKDAASWCSVSRSSGSNTATVRVIVTNNSTDSQRTAKITVKGRSSGDETIVIVTQNAEEAPAEDDNSLPVTPSRRK